MMDEAKIIEVWKKGIQVDGYNPMKVRKDACGAWIIYDLYGDTNSPFGWVIDHIIPKSKLSGNGIPEEKQDDLLNLRPLNWKNNQSKSDSYPIYKTAVTSEDDYIVEKTVSMSVNPQVQKSLADFYKIEL